MPTVVDLYLESISRTARLSDSETVRLGRILSRALDVAHVSFPDGSPTATVIVHDHTDALPSEIVGKVESILGPFQSQQR
jgi:hypothetical protein